MSLPLKKQVKTLQSEYSINKKPNYENPWVFKSDCEIWLSITSTSTDYKWGHSKEKKKYFFSRLWQKILTQFKKQCQ